MSTRRVPGVAALVMLGAAFPGRGQPVAVVTPRAATVVAGRTCAFQARGHPEAAWAWALEGVGHIDPVTGRYTAPPVSGPTLVTIRAAHRRLPGLAAEARLLVLPWEPFDVVGQVLGRDWLLPFTLDLPFVDLATGRRAGAAAAGVSSAPPGFIHGGYGIPFDLTWDPQPEAQGVLLSCSAGKGVTRLDVTGRTSQELVVNAPAARCTVEGLRPVPGGWHSRIQTFTLHFQGLVPFAGRPQAEPGHADGPAGEARFREPFGLARVVAVRPGAGARSSFLVSDAGSHVIRLVSPERDVSTPWGLPDVPGHRDREPSLLRRVASTLCLEGLLGPPEAPSLFREPTFLCLTEAGFPREERSWQCLVADTGNHCLRVLRPEGRVATLAGEPGEAGHRDAPCRREARFNRPMGLAEDGQGNVYVADQGNRVIRRIDPGGEVSTLAGSPGEAGTRDGRGAQARFTELRGLALYGDPLGAHALFAADGHAIRRIALPDGEVTTVLGVVATPGRQEVLEGPRTHREAALRQPCLDRPCGLLAVNTGLRIADQGNHCLRTWHFEAATLATIAGGPGQARTRWGLLCTGLGVALDERFATLEAPRTVQGDAPFSAGLIVTTGTGLAEVFHDGGRRDALGPVVLEVPEADLGQACAVRFSVAAGNAAGEPVVRPVHFSVDFLEPDGTLAERARGRGTTAEAMSAVGQFGQRGVGSVVVRCVTDQGRCAGAERRVTIH